MIRTMPAIDSSERTPAIGFARKAIASIAGVLVLVLSTSFAYAVDIEVTNLNDSGADSLREALESAVEGDQIIFNVPGGGTINLLTDLPDVTESLSFTNSSGAAIIIDRGATGPLSITGGEVDLGDLQVTGAGTDIEIGSDATLIGDDDTIIADIVAAGTISPNGSGTVGDIVVDGTLDATDSTIQVDINGGAADPNDLIDTTGDVTITDATLAPNFIGSDYSVGDTFTVVESDTAVNGTLANDGDVFALPSNPFLQAIIDTTTPTLLALEIEDNGLSFVSFVDGCNQVQSAGALDTLFAGGTAAQMAVITGLREGSGDEVNAAVGQLSGSLFPSIIDGEINQIQNQLHSIRDRVLLQRSELVQPGRLIPWVRAYGMTMSTDEDSCNTAGYRQEVGGVELGIGMMTESGWGMHGFTQLGSSDTWIRGIDQTADSDSYRGGGSIQFVGNGLYVLGTGGFGYQEHETRRTTDAFTTGSFAESEFDGTDQFGYLETGTTHVSDDLIWLNFISVQGIRVELDPASESGGSDFNLNVNRNGEESVRSMLGFSLAKSAATSLGQATTQVRVGWLHEYLDEVRFAGTSIDTTGFSAQSTGSGRDWISTGVQLDWAFLLGGQLTLAYQGNLNSRSAFQSGLIGTRWVW